jgi:hypothetical protein
MGERLAHRDVRQHNDIVGHEPMIPPIGRGGKRLEVVNQVRHMADSLTFDSARSRGARNASAQRQTD